MVDACAFVRNLPDELYRPMAKSESRAPRLGVGCSSDLTIRELEETIRDVVGSKGRLTFDPCKPDRMPQKSLDLSWTEELGWQPAIPFRAGLTRVYQEYLATHSIVERRPIRATRVIP